MSISDWKLTWNDEFDGPAGADPDPHKWGFASGGDGWGNQEWQYYTDQTENACLDGAGALVITGLKLDDDNLRGYNCWYGPCRYSSARLLTKEKFAFTYGRVEARIQLPSGKGVWPAFWMIGHNIDEVNWPNCGEIDIMENVGHEKSTVYGSLHGPGYSGEDSISAQYMLPDSSEFTSAYHLFGIEWEPESLCWYVDGNQYAQVLKKRFSARKPWVFDHPFYLIINLAIGGIWPGYPDSSIYFPQKMRIDYVRVYQHP